MSFFEANGWGQKVAHNKVNGGLSTIGGGQTAWSGRQRRHDSRDTREINFTARMREQDVADTLLGMSLGLGWRFPLTRNLNATRGKVPESGFSVTFTPGGGKFAQGGCTVATDPVWDLELRSDFWTAGVWKNNGSFYDHWWVQADGTTLKNSVADTDPGIFDVSATNGAFTLKNIDANPDYTDLVVFPFIAAQEAMVAWYTWMAVQGRPFSPLPAWWVTGDVLNTTSADTGELYVPTHGRSKYTPFGKSDGAGGGDWIKHARDVHMSFTREDNSRGQVTGQWESWEWNADQITTGSTYADKRKTGATTTNVNGTAGQVGPYGKRQSIALNGSTAYISIDDDLEQFIAGKYGFSAMLWVKRDGTATQENLLSIMQTSLANKLGMRFLANDRLEAFYRVQSGDSIELASVSGFGVADIGWHLVGFALDLRAQVLDLFVDDEMRTVEISPSAHQFDDTLFNDHAWGVNSGTTKTDYFDGNMTAGWLFGHRIQPSTFFKAWERGYQGAFA